MRRTDIEWFSRTAPELHPKRAVLVRDDDPQRRKKIMRALEGLGLQARPYPEAGPIPECHLIVASLAPDDESTATVLRATRAAGALTPFIVYGPRLHRARRREIEALGGVVTLRSPVDLDDLCTAAWAMAKRSQA